MIRKAQTNKRGGNMFKRLSTVGLAAVALTAVMAVTVAAGPNPANGTQQRLKDGSCTYAAETRLRIQDPDRLKLRDGSCVYVSVPVAGDKLQDQLHQQLRDGSCLTV